MPFVEINKVKLFYEDKGPKTGIPLVCIHGWTADNHRWDNQMDYFSKMRRVIRFDVRGHGESEKPQKEYFVKQLSEDLNELLTKLGIKKAILAGHSMGGMTIIQFALDYPEKVEKLILVDTVGKFTFSFARKIMFSSSNLLPFKFFVKLNIVRAFKKGFPKKKLNEFIKLSQKTPKYVVKSFYYDMARWDVMDKLKSIKAKTLIIHGYYDIQFPLSEAIKVALNMPNAIIKVVDSGHEVPLEVPEKVTLAMADFIG